MLDSDKMVRYNISYHIMPYYIHDRLCMIYECIMYASEGRKSNDRKNKFLRKGIYGHQRLLREIRLKIKIS